MPKKTKDRPMSKNKNILIPKLRFPEFENCGEWEELSGDKLFKSVSNKKHNSDLPILAITQEYGAIPRELIDYTVIASQKSIKNYKVVEKGDFIISLRAFQGGIEYSEYRGICSPAYIILRKKKNINEIFFKFYFKTKLYIRQLNKNLEGIRDGKMVSYKQFSEILLPHPLIQEQQKIASCLSSLDELIEAHSQKLELLKQHKKGLMQNLFPQEGEKVPKLRFKEFENYGEWEVKKLGKVGKFIGGGTPKRSNSNFWSGNIPWISSSDIKENDLHNISISYLINDNAIKQSATKIIPKGSILFVSRVGVGKLAVNKKELCTSQDFTNLVPNKSVINYFIGYYFMSNKNRLLSLVQGTSIQGFSKIDLENLKLSFPKNKKEQQKIASCLSYLDDLIAAQTEKIKQLKQHKKGLMQGLFPLIL